MTTFSKQLGKYIIRKMWGIVICILLGENKWINRNKKPFIHDRGWEIIKE